MFAWRLSNYRLENKMIFTSFTKVSKFSHADLKIATIY